MAWLFRFRGSRMCTVRAGDLGRHVAVLSLLIAVFGVLPTRVPSSLAVTAGYAAAHPLAASGTLQLKVTHQADGAYLIAVSGRYVAFPSALYVLVHTGASP